MLPSSSPHSPGAGLPGCRLQPQALLHKHLLQLAPVHCRDHPQGLQAAQGKQGSSSQRAQARPEQTGRAGTGQCFHCGKAACKACWSLEQILL